jgi:Ca-activated chloride channel family protein
MASRPLRILGSTALSLLIAGSASGPSLAFRLPATEP